MPRFKESRIEESVFSPYFERERKNRSVTKKIRENWRNFFFFTKFRDKIKFQLSLKNLHFKEGKKGSNMLVFLFVDYGFESEKVGREKNDS